MTNYDASSIEWLQGAEAIRAQVSLYLGDKGSVGLTHMADEIVVNSIDESTNGFGDTIAIDITGDTITVADHGRGIPVGPHPKHPTKDVLTLVATEIHAGGKSSVNNTGYKKGAGGVHGVGLSVVNALSKKLEIWSCRNKKWYYQAFKRGIPEGPKPVVVKTIPEVDGHSMDAGTIIRFVPDSTLFDKGSKFLLEPFLEKLRTRAWFATCNKQDRNGNIKERIPLAFAVTYNGKEHDVVTDGLASYFDSVLEVNNLEHLTPDPFVVQTDNVDLLLGWANDDTDRIDCYTNIVHNPMGGTHLTSLQKMIMRVFSTFGGKRAVYKVEDLMAGAVVLLNVHIEHPSFASQDKRQLKSVEASELVASVEPELVKWAKKNRAVVKSLIDRACAINKAVESAKTDRKIASQLNLKTKGKTVYPEKMLLSTTKDPKKRELFICEGDSALGTAKFARDIAYQEVMPIRGKIGNVIRTPKHFKSEDVLDVLRAVGYSPSTGIEGMRVQNKIVFLTDADVDGSHISLLLLGLFFSAEPKLFELGMIFMAKPPLFSYVKSDGSRIYGDTVDFLRDNVTGKFDAERVTRFKGLGEMNAESLRETSFDPNTRKLIQVTPEKVKGYLVNLQGKDGTLRKNLLGVE